MTSPNPPSRHGCYEALGGKADLVLTDMAPNTTGHTATDHLRIMALAEAALEFAVEVLAEGGCFVAKVFQGGAERPILDQMKRRFTTVRHAKPPASRKESSELYVVATGFRPADLQWSVKKVNSPQRRRDRGGKENVLCARRIQTLSASSAPLR